MTKSSTLTEGTWPTPLMPASNPVGPGATVAMPTVTTGVGAVEELGSSGLSTCKSAGVVLKRVPIHTSTSAGAALLAVLDVGHSTSTLSVVVVPVSAG